jgi:hypothetical protein
MNRIFIVIISFVVFCLLAYITGVWWLSLAGLTAFVFQYSLKSWQYFLWGFVMMAFSWLFTAFYLEFTDASIISNRVSQIVQLPHFMVFVLTGFIGGLLGGVYNLTISELKKLMR